MQNTGTWNSDLTVIFAACLFAPIAFYFMGGCISAFRSSNVSMDVDLVESDYQTDELQNWLLDNVRSDEDIWKRLKQDAVTQAMNGDAKARDWLTKHVFLNNSPVNDGTPDSIKLDAVDSLIALGRKKADAKLTIDQLCSKQCYNSAEDLIQDAFKC